MINYICALFVQERGIHSFVQTLCMVKVASVILLLHLSCCFPCKCHFAALTVVTLPFCSVFYCALAGPVLDTI